MYWEVQKQITIGAELGSYSLGVLSFYGVSTPSLCDMPSASQSCPLELSLAQRKLSQGFLCTYPVLLTDCIKTEAS